jgi:hypothetical protein
MLFPSLFLAPNVLCEGCRARQLIFLLINSFRTLYKNTRVVPLCLSSGVLPRYPPSMPDPNSPPKPSPAVGLCSSCRHARTIESAKGSSFLLCLRSVTDPAFPKYPRLPVLACPGHEPTPAPEPTR